MCITSSLDVAQPPEHRDHLLLNRINAGRNRRGYRGVGKLCRCVTRRTPAVQIEASNKIHLRRNFLVGTGILKYWRLPERWKRLTQLRVLRNMDSVRGKLVLCQQDLNKNIACDTGVQLTASKGSVRPCTFCTAASGDTSQHQTIFWSDQGIGGVLK